MIKAFSVTDIGKRRQLNQDYIYASEKAVGNLPNLFIVADGMGGHKAGDFAAKCAVETICDQAARSFEKNPVRILKKAIEVANDNIHRKAEEDISYEGMGTTVVAAACLGKYLQIANVGDSRLYVIGNEIKQITTDHSLVEEMIRMGGIERKAARNHPDKNIITRAIGANSTVDIDFFSVELKPRDKVLMCSDGLTNMLEDEEIRIIVQGAESIEEAAGELIFAANARGGRDNISVILIEQIA